MSEQEYRESCDSVIDRMEDELRSTGVLSQASQEELREMLRLDRHELSTDEDRRISALLNPRNAPVIELSDKSLRDEYHKTTEDNYATSCSSYADRMAEYDEAHGYYVTLKTDIID